MQNDLDENSTNHTVDVPLGYLELEPFGPSLVCLQVLCESSQFIDFINEHVAFWSSQHPTKG